MRVFQMVTAIAAMSLLNAATVNPCRCKITCRSICVEEHDIVWMKHGHTWGNTDGQRDRKSITKQ